MHEPGLDTVNTAIENYQMYFSAVRKNLNMGQILNTIMNIILCYHYIEDYLFLGDTLKYLG